MANPDDYCENCSHHIGWHKKLEFIKEIDGTTFYDATHSNLSECTFDNCNCKEFKKPLPLLKKNKLITGN